ncbi:MAG: hypothetical protein PHV82_15960 [Victivallaceae bacterium]|nr:hypothetical protein [Victivallaceae bacterium]
MKQQKNFNKNKIIQKEFVVTKRPKPMKQGSRDDFQTPQEAVNILLPFLNKDWTIWECACGKGNLYKAFLEKEFKVVATDILYGIDFLEYSYQNEINIEFDCIITNPPYSIKEKFLEKCYELKKPFALLMPLTALEGEIRQKHYRKYGGIQLLIPNKRYNFETPNGKGSSAWFATAWFCGNMNLPQDLNFVEIKKNRT